MRRGLAWLAVLCSVGCASDLPAVEDGSSTTTSGGSSSGEVLETTTVGPGDTTEHDTTSGSVTSTTTGEPVPCTSDDECTDPDQPFCSPVLQACVSCSGMPEPDEACASDNGALPACDEGVCVQCTTDVLTQCTGTVPICDEEANTCVACTEHEQCGDAACNLFTGACVAGSVLTVGPGAEDHATLNDAVAAVLAGGGGTIIVSQDVYNEAVSVDMAGAVVAFLANGDDRPEWLRTLGVAQPQLTVSTGATVLVEGLDFRSNPALGQPAVRAAGGALWLDRTIIAQQTGVALSAESTMDMVVRNSFIAGAADVVAVSVTSSAVDLQSTTVGASLGDAVAIACDAGSDVDVSDSIIVSRGAGPEVDCAALAATHTASNTALPMGSSNVEVGPTMTAWFAAYNTGDFHLTPGAGVPTFENIAEWNDGDPSVDIDDEPRMTVDGAAEPAGADLP